MKQFFLSVFLFKIEYYPHYSHVLLSSSLNELDDMIKPFRLHESKDPARAEAMRTEQPWKISDKELSTFEEKVRFYIQRLNGYAFFGMIILISLVGVGTLRAAHLIKMIPFNCFAD